jgi:predicted CoA-substrate-specific enzyme activase
MSYSLGLDIGSISINVVVMNEEQEIVETRYVYHHGRPYFKLREVLGELTGRYGEDAFSTIATTGTGGKLAAELVGGHFVNEIVAQSASVERLYPHAKTIIEMGGEDSKLIFMDKLEGSEETHLSDFTMNAACAAGTGSFLDQQAKRIGVSIEKEFGEMALKSEDPPRIAGRCSVFAKSDMIHLQQIATPVHDIVAGLCFAVARNFKSNIARGKDLKKPIVFQGGVSLNAGVVRAFRELLDIRDGELIIPEKNTSMGAIGALYQVLTKQNGEAKGFVGFEKLEGYLESDRTDGKFLEPLTEAGAKILKEIKFSPNGSGKLEVYLGLDIGSLSTNVVLIDKDDNVVARRYLPTASRPLEAIRRGLKEINEEVGAEVVVKAAGTTGSGRYLTGDFIGADTIQNEITAQATAAIAYDPTVDTIFEIGGQDSKYISIENGVVVDFEMNKVCAAGTGSFLQEQAEKLDINIIEEFGDLALEAQQPCHLGDRCTVFMESDLNTHQQKGVNKENLVGGLAYSIVQNYIQKVVGHKRIGNRIFFQGGVTNNKAVVAAFEKVTGKKITVPPHFDVTGAIGAAMLARDAVGRGETRFKGFDVSEVPYTVDKFTCKSCSNHCEIRRIRIEGEEKPLFYGGRCEKYEIEERKGKGQGIPNLFEERTKMLMGDFDDAASTADAAESEVTTIGIPRALMIYYQQFPFWRTFFKELGFRVVLSEPSNAQLVSTSLEMLTAETCLPVEVMHGHVFDLIEKGVDYIFTPFVVNVEAKEDNPTVNYNCPWVQTYPFMIKTALKDTEHEDKLLIPALHFRYPGKVLNNDLSSFMKETFGTKKSSVVAAVEKALAVQHEFEAAVSRRGREVLANLPADKRAAVILGRPYNTGDPELNLSLVEKLINLDVLPIPVDFLPLDEVTVFDDYPYMYWPNGQKILAASRIVAKDDRLDAVYLGNFRCGPDSFINHFVAEELKNKPYLQLEVDEHSADAGMITRCEAFLDSLKGRDQIDTKNEPNMLRAHGFYSHASSKRTLYYPYMRDGAYALAAASRSCGIDAWVLPQQTEEDIAIGRQYTSSKECYPMICTTGSFLKKVLEPGFQADKASFFMPSHNGPCRFGQYNRFQRMLFNRLGHADVTIVSPSNDNNYEDLSGGHGNKFRIAAVRGVVAVDLLRKLKQERIPYEKTPGQTEEVYQKTLDMAIKSVERGAKDLPQTLYEAAEEFRAIPVDETMPRKPIIAVVGEIFMRDNPFCSGFLVQRLEALGAETIIAPFREWLTYSTYRFERDSRWKGSTKGILQSKLQGMFTHRILSPLDKAVAHVGEMEREVDLEEMVSLCDPYIHRDYDGDPVLNIGMTRKLVETGISGVANVLPFMCMPGTLVTALSHSLRKDYDNLPYVNIAYDGQDDSGIETRLEAFMHQARQYAETHGLTEPRKWD